MAAKRKSAAMLGKITKMAEESKKLKKDNETDNKNNKENECKENETFSEVDFSKETEYDRYFEYIQWRRNLPSLLGGVEEELDNEVKKRLNINENINVTKNGNSSPILDTFSCELGKSVTTVLAPPTLKCLLCEKDLTKHNEQSQVTLFNIDGPVLATKYIWRCKNCKGQWKLNLKTAAIWADVAYHPECYGNPSAGFRFYDETFEVKVVRASAEVYFSSLFVSSYNSDLQHGWMSSVAKTESYNDTFHDSKQVKTFKNILKSNPKIGKHFNRKAKNKSETEEATFGEDDKTEAETSNNEETTNVNSESIMFEMKRKSLTQALLTFEAIKELQERKLTNDTFGPKVEDNEHITFKKSADNFMEKIENLRKFEIYEHFECSPACAERGCKWVIAVDGLWKLRYPICMWDTKHSYPADLQEYLPNACTNSPESGKAFCTLHCGVADQLGRPTKLNDFLASCGADPKAFTKEGKSQVTEVLQNMANEAQAKNLKTNNDSDTQGINYLLRNSDIAKKENFVPEKNSEADCRKDTGEKVVHKLTRSRGVMVSVSGGGIIRNWAPIFKSEGPTQTSLLMTNFLQNYLGEIIPDPEDWNNFFLSYDNMCHVDELKILNQPLSLPEPYNKMWSKINKVIDPLHIKNHTRGQCKILYDPKNVTLKYPKGNMMQCEQTFAWMSRYKKILNSTSKSHFNFLLHRLVIGRNRYTERCYRDGRRPVLPSAVITKE